MLLWGYWFVALWGVVRRLDWIGTGGSLGRGNDDDDGDGEDGEDGLAATTPSTFRSRQRMW